MTEVEFWALAATDLEEAKASPLFDLLTLAYPEKWAEVELECSEDWIRNTLNFMALLPKKLETMGNLWIADCIEHVSWVFSQFYPEDDRLTLHTQRRRAYAASEISGLEFDNELYNIQRYSEVMRDAEVNDGLGRSPGRLAGRNLLAACGWGHPGIVYRDIGDGVMSEVYPFPEAGPRCREEYLWQWRRLLWYIRGEKDV